MVYRSIDFHSIHNKIDYLDTYFLLLAYRDLSTAQNNIDYLR